MRRIAHETNCIIRVEFVFMVLYTNLQCSLHYGDVFNNARAMRVRLIHRIRLQISSVHLNAICLEQRLGAKMFIPTRKYHPSPLLAISTSESTDKRDDIGMSKASAIFQMTARVGFPSPCSIFSKVNLLTPNCLAIASMLISFAKRMLRKFSPNLWTGICFR